MLHETEIISSNSSLNFPSPLCKHVKKKKKMEGIYLECDLILDQDPMQYLG